MNPLGLVTGKLGLYAAGAAVVLLSAGLIYQTVQLAAIRTKVATLERDAATVKSAAEQAARIQSEKHRATEAQRYRDQQKAINDAHTEAAVARADASAADAALQRLRQRVAADSARRAATGYPTAPASGPAAVPATDVPADVLGGLGEAAGQLAAYADAARIAGLACERSYTSLTEGGQ